MEVDDDMIVLVVVDDDKDTNTSDQELTFSSENNIGVDDLLETAQKYGQFIAVKQEPADDCPDYDEVPVISIKQEIKEEPTDNTQIEDNDDDYIPYDDDNILDDDNVIDDECLDSDDLYAPKKKRTTRRRKLKPWQGKSFIADLRQEYEDLREDKELLIYTLEKIMNAVQAPPPPKDFCIINGVKFECVQCGYLAETMPAAGRHHQEKHGERYLVCYACGADFRSTTNLYKHEKRCLAPDADIVLRARAAWLGRKGRSRPYLTSDKFFGSKRNECERKIHCCHLCSAVFITKSNLESHVNLHRGERPYRCHACPCAYTSQSALSRHVKKHTDDVFICDYCSREFKLKAALVSHMDTHKSIRKYGCDECSRRFAQKSALLLHVNRDHRKLPPPCACQLCPKRYPRMSILKAHMKRAHGMSIMTRKMFFKSLPTMTELEFKESKVIRKLEENIDSTQFFQKQEDDRDNKELTVENNVSSNKANENEITAKDFMKYVTKSDGDLGTNVIVIENGVVINARGISDDNYVLQVESMGEQQGLVDYKTGLIESE